MAKCVLLTEREHLTGIPVLSLNNSLVRDLSLSVNSFSLPVGSLLIVPHGTFIHLKNALRLPSKDPSTANAIHYHSFLLQYTLASSLIAIPVRKSSIRSSIVERKIDIIAL